MEKEVISWSVKELRGQFSLISFPEYQREPNLWTLVEKQRLIDSMIRHFDIASLYLYQHNDGAMDCVDGRQRIGSIMSFLGENNANSDTNFPFRPLNEILQEECPPYQSLAGKTFNEIEQLRKTHDDPTAAKFVDTFLGYPLTVIMLSDSKAGEEFNLQFTRLNLGTIINSGEKLHAMVGDLRDACFNRLGNHPFLEGTNIPTRRFAREQVAAQILAQVFSFSANGVYTRIRHFDLQRIFKEHRKFTDDQEELVEQIRKLFDLLREAFIGIETLRNRAITVSTVLLAWQSKLDGSGQASQLAEFIDEFVHRLNWQVKKGLDLDREYLYLTTFQHNITQASSEKSSIEARAKTLQEEFFRWRCDGELKGDSDWRLKNPTSDPGRESRSS